MNYKQIISHKHLFTALVVLSSLTASAQQMAGGDVSMLPKYEAANVKYYTQNGTTISNVLTHLHDEAGFSIIRLRLFVNPTGETGVVQDLDYVKTLGQRVKAAGMKLMLDFHYSDTWADPSNQWTPEAWKSLTDAQLYDKIYDYTKTCLTELVAAGAQPDYIQTGNEISYGMLWGPKGTSSPKKCYTSNNANWDRFRTLLGKAGQACREVCPQAKIIIHTERTGNWSTTKGVYEKLSSVDYDIIGLSYYPEWHNNLATLKATLLNIRNTFADKPVMIVETGYYNNWYPSNASYNFTSTWPASPDGQKKFLDQLVETVKPLTHVQAIIYWFPEENPYQNRVYEPWYNHGLFNPNNGRASEALYSLKAFADDETGVNQIPQLEDNGTYTDKAATPWTTLGGQVLSGRPTTKGIYVKGGKKVVVK